MGHTIGSQQGSYGDPDSVNRTEDNEGSGDNGEGTADVNPTDMTGTLETSDPDNTQDADDVSAAVDAGLVPEGQGPDIPDANQQIVVVDGEPQTVAREDVASVVADAGGNPDVANDQGDANESGTTDTTTDSPSTGKESTGGEDEAKDPNGTMAEGDDPSDFNVGPVNKYLSSLSPSDAEYKRVLKAEKKGKARQGIVDA